MTIAEMHVLFRQLAQQMGMQNVRAILPEQIDLLLNTSISDTVNRIIKENVALTNGGNNSKVGQINALKPLYKQASASFIDGTFVYDDKVSLNNVVFQQQTSTITDMLYIISYSVNYAEIKTESDTYAWFWRANNTCHHPTKKVDGYVSRFFDVRLVEAQDVQKIVNDNLLKPTNQSPIGYLTDKFNIMFGKFNLVGGDTEGYCLEKLLTPYTLLCNYIAKPVVVKHSTNVSCNLPEHLHVDIVKYAVQLWQISVNNQSTVNRENNNNQ